jgi:hypothetical protein
LRKDTEALIEMLNAQVRPFTERPKSTASANAETWKTLFVAAETYRRIVIVAHGSKWPSPRLHFGDRVGKGFRPNWNVNLKDVYSSVQLDCEVLAMLACYAQQQRASFSGEWESMATAFLAKGARAILAAHYAQHVPSASILLLKVFEELTSGESVAAALRRVQRGFIEKKVNLRYAHPYYWAVTCIGAASPKQPKSHMCGSAWSMGIERSSAT